MKQGGESTPTAIDLFCGAGGATNGLKGAGLNVIYAVEKDQPAASTYRANHSDVNLCEGDILRLDPSEVRRSLGVRIGALDVLKTCPPCQSFSSLGNSPTAEMGRRLIRSTVDWVEAFSPRVVMLENVPGVRRSSAYRRLTGVLGDLGYAASEALVEASEFGLPQRRRRLFLVAFRDVNPDTVAFWKPPRGKSPSAWESIRALEKRSRADSDPANRARRLAPKTLERVRAIPVNGSRFDLPASLMLRCHAKVAKNATGSYGRVPTEGPSATMTTRCTTPSCGQFIHPTEDRGLTLREAATLQGFPARYRFEGFYDQIERQIGNAVPSPLVRTLARRALRLLERTKS